MTKNYPDWFKKRPLVTIPQLFCYRYETWSKWSTHEYIMLPEYKPHWIKNVHSLLMAYFWTSPDNFYSLSISSILRPFILRFVGIYFNVKIGKKLCLMRLELFSSGWDLAIQGGTSQSWSKLATFNIQSPSNLQTFSINN